MQVQSNEHYFNINRPDQRSVDNLEVLDEREENNKTGHEQEEYSVSNASEIRQPLSEEKLKEFQEAIKGEQEKETQTLFQSTQTFIQKYQEEVQNNNQAKGLENYKMAMLGDV